MAVSAPLPDQLLDREIRAIERVLDEHGSTEGSELARLVGARSWGPGVFSQALHTAMAEGRVERTSRSGDPGGRQVAGRLTSVVGRRSLLATPRLLPLRCIATMDAGG
ncbi:MAG: hypothetical protein ACRDZQ_06575 [Acidimicrobiales bacterium]